MAFIADLHVHSRYSRATSAAMCPEGLWRWAQLKGIEVIGTGDFTHPGWIAELDEKLRPAEDGLFMLRPSAAVEGVPEHCRADVRFILSAEVSSIYSKGGRTRKVHSVLLAPGFDEARALNARLARIGNLHSDGRPILGLDARRLLEIALEVSTDIEVIPAHAWTPHFSVFGAASGFDSLEECYEDLAPHIHAIETGLSSDPLMNRRLSALDRITLVSNSDAHSPQKLGREATLFDCDRSYPALIRALRTREGYRGTIEFFPEEGKYHHDGHRKCGISFTPSETIAHKGICPVCGRKLTVGVLHRVEGLADRAMAEGNGFRYIVPLPEIIAESMGRGVNTKRVTAAYMAMIEGIGNEFHILLDAPIEDIARAAGARIADGIGRMRRGEVGLTPGFDGEYGKVSVF